jgi:hypothetical protein
MPVFKGLEGTIRNIGSINEIGKFVIARMFFVVLLHLCTCVYDFCESLVPSALISHIPADLNLTPPHAHDKSPLATNQSAPT